MISKLFILCGVVTMAITAMSGAEVASKMVAKQAPQHQSGGQP